jgi:hypothetical protein
VRCQTTIKRGAIDETTRSKLEDWRDLVSNSMFGPSTILKDESIEFLSSLGRMTEREHFASALVGHWKWEARYGGELFGLLLHEDIGALFVALPKRTWGMKCPAAKLDDQPTQPGIFTFAVTTQEEQCSQLQAASGSQATKRQ